MNICVNDASAAVNVFLCSYYVLIHLLDHVYVIFLSVREICDVTVQVQWNT